MLEEELICEECNGSGYIVVDSGKTDICDSCMGLGYVKGVYDPGPLSPTKTKIKRAFMFTFIALAIYYAGFTYSFIHFSLGPVKALIILLIGHMAAVTFLVFYLLSRSIRDGV